MSSLILLIVANLIMNVFQIFQGRDTLKKNIRDSKLKRAEKEALEEAEEQERRLKKKREEEEFTRLPDEGADQSGFGGNVKTGKGKGKGDFDDNVAGIGADDFDKKRKKKKNNQDALVDDDYDESRSGP